jgi:hypothetical protein
MADEQVVKGGDPYARIHEFREIGTTPGGQAVYAEVVALEANSVGAGSTYTTRLDDVGTGVTYVGEAAIGSAESAATWRIKKITETGSDIVILYADGDGLFNNIWDDRLSLSYA